VHHSGIIYSLRGGVKSLKNYHHLNLEEREKFFVLKALGLSLREIGKRSGRSHTSLSREFQRHTKYGKEYLPCLAQKRADRWALKQRAKCPLKNPAIFLYVREHLRRPYYWSPEEIAGRLSMDHPEYSIHHETIYRYIYSGRYRTGGVKLWEHLKLHRKRRMKWHGRKVKGQGKLPTALKIEDRPEKANSRKEEGHWETDNVGTIKTDKTGISATVERKSRVIRLRKLQNGKAKTKRRVLVTQVKRENARFQKTVTIDRGPENSDHEEFTRQTEMPVYACNPYHSWEKGSVENGIGRSRFFIPKGSSVDRLKQKDLTRIEDIMNNTPRKTLGYLTPNEVYEKIVNGSYT